MEHKKTIRFIATSMHEKTQIVLKNPFKQFMVYDAQRGLEVVG